MPLERERKRARDIRWLLQWIWIVVVVAMVVTYKDYSHHSVDCSILTSKPYVRHLDRLIQPPDLVVICACRLVGRQNLLIKRLEIGDQE
ncbi:hypothetical protein M8C21_004748 [Ambrosia artemisiifolia]|uniref:Uncharacterized protein n=1 Tax=Ambrosia artemisiifolia TaxID=4212 RepID=A0AAD5C7J6_AMBAR|nr:hypothetical protein M8C21_004748 [Ambrosia artemisiifolia]